MRLAAVALMLAARHERPRAGAGSATAVPPAPTEPPHALVSLSAVFAPGDKEPIRSALTWRVFDARADAEGAHALIAESQDATPSFSLPDGDYIVHVACGLAGATRADHGLWRSDH